MSHQQLQAQNNEAARKYRLNPASLGRVLQAVQDHPEVVQLIQLAAQLRGNPNLVGQFQQQADRLAVSVLASLDGVMEYVTKAEQGAGVTPSPMFAQLHQAVDQLLAQYGQAATDHLAPAAPGT